jgi:hypothetical protein
MLKVMDVSLPVYNPLKPVVPICTIRFNIKNSTLCTHYIYVFCTDVTAVISLCSINRLVCVTETERIYCARRVGSLYVIRINFRLQNNAQPIFQSTAFTILTSSFSYDYQKDERAKPRNLLQKWLSLSPTKSNRLLLLPFIILSSALPTVSYLSLFSPLKG